MNDFLGMGEIIKQQRERIEQLEAKNEELRAALQDILNDSARYRVLSIAREALKP